MMALAQVSSPDTKTVSSLEVKKKEEALRCDTEEEISVKCTVVGEAPGSVGIMYLVSGGWLDLHDETGDPKTVHGYQLVTFLRYMIATYCTRPRPNAGWTSNIKLLSLVSGKELRVIICSCTTIQAAFV